MKRILAGVVIAIVLISLGVLRLDDRGARLPFHPGAKDILHDGTYTLHGEKFTLRNGSAETSDSATSSKVVTRYFGNDATGDLNNDGRTDRAFLITQETGGTGTFFYLVALLDTPKGKIGTQAAFIGDRIAPQNTSIDPQGIVLVNYADRKISESFTTPPSIGKSLYLKLDPATGQFGEVVRGFEGEADPSRMTLGMQKWVWINTLYGDGKEVKPKAVNRFSITFQSDGRFSAGTDCNMIGGAYTAKSGIITFTDMVSTQMFCANSQEREFIDMLQQSQSYFFTSKGQLVFNLKYDSGSFIFR